MSTGPGKRVNDARETTTEPMEGIALDCWPGPGNGGGRHEQRWRWGVSLGPRGAGRGLFPEGHLRSRRGPLLQVHAPGGPGRGTSAGRWRRRDAKMRRAPARAVRARPRGGAGSGGGGKRTPCVAICKGSDTGCQLDFRSGIRLATLVNLDLQPALICRSVRESLLFRVFASAAGPLRGHRPVEAPSALHHLVCRVSFDTWRHANILLLSSFKGPTWGPSCGLPR
jgi:hypothetical protein